jgi:hypothetical protein
MARKKADIPSTDFNQKNAVSAIPMGQSRVWMEIKGQGNSAQVSVGEETNLLIKALLPGERKCHNCMLSHFFELGIHKHTCQLMQ